MWKIIVAFVLKQKFKKRENETSEKKKEILSEWEH